MKGKIIAITLLATLASSISVFAVQKESDMNKSLRAGYFQDFNVTMPAYQGTLYTPTQYKRSATESACFKKWEGPEINISARRGSKQVSKNATVSANGVRVYSPYTTTMKVNELIQMALNTRTSSSSGQYLRLSWSADTPK